MFALSRAIWRNSMRSPDKSMPSPMCVPKFMSPICGNRKAAAAAVKAATNAFGKLDILVNNAGATKRADFFTLTEEDWQDGFALKFHGYVRMTRAAWPHLKSVNGNIVNIVGIGSRAGSAEFTIGAQVNVAILNFTKAMADIGVKDGVRVTRSTPG